MKKVFLSFFLVLAVFAITACSTPNGNTNNNVAPVIENSFFMMDIDATRYLLENTDNWNTLEYLSSELMTTSSKYLLLVVFNDPDIDVCELQTGWSKENLLPYKFEQSYEN